MDWELLFIVLLAVGAIQGIVLGLLLLRARQYNGFANRILAILLFFLSYQLSSEILMAVGVIHAGTFLYHFFLEYNWVYGALVFFYVTGFLNPHWRIRKTDWLHFVPIAVEFCISNFIKTQNFFWDGTRESLSWLGLWGYVIWVQTPIQEVVGAGLVIGYSWFALSRIQNVTLRYPGFATKLTWIQVLLRLYIAVALGVAGWSMIDFLFFDYAFNPSYIYPSYISISILTYAFGLLGFMHRNDSFASRAVNKKYAGGELESILSSFEEAVKEKQLYLNPKLSLADVADSMDVKPYQLTEALNGIKGISFKEYINACRVEEVLRLMKNQAYQQYTLTAIAFEAGFNSKATFNRIFRKATGKSPSEVKDEMTISGAE